jgi:3-oxoacyl-[acyl-carrier protein] reductase
MSRDDRTGPRWAVVAGGRGSLGRPIAEHLADRGWHVLSLDRTADTAADPARPTLVARTIDASDAGAVEQALAAAIPSGEPIALLVNAVGLIWNEPILTLRGASFHAHGVESWREAIEANLTTPFIVASRVAMRMARSGGGAIVNFSSVTARGNPGQAAYGAAKAGIEGLTRAMAAELGPLGIRVNAIAPGFIDVASTRAALQPSQLSQIVDRTPSRRLGTVQEVIGAIEFLASNTFVNGVVLDVNGGLRI